jgi:hypothetical protein
MTDKRHSPCNVIGGIALPRRLSLGGRQNTVPAVSTCQPKIQVCGFPGHASGTRESRRDEQTQARIYPSATPALSSRTNCHPPQRTRNRGWDWSATAEQIQTLCAYNLTHPCTNANLPYGGREGRKEARERHNPALSAVHINACDRAPRDGSRFCSVSLFSLSDGFMTVSSTRKTSLGWLSAVVCSCGYSRDRERLPDPETG